MKATAFAVVACLLALAVSAEESAPVELPSTFTLDDALALALDHSYTIRQARARYAEATGVLTESRAAQLPTLSANANYNRVDRGLLEAFPGTETSLSSPTSWSAGVQIQQNLYSGGAITSGIRAARASREAAQADFESAVQTALLEVRERYYGVLLAREQVDVQEQAVQLLEDELANARARVRAGSGSPFDELRAEVALANGQPALIRARNSYRLAAVELLRVIGLPTEDGMEDRIGGELGFTPREYTLEDLLTSARERRPELQVLEKQVTAAEHFVDNARSGARPNLGAVAGYGIQKSSFSDDLDDTNDGWTVGVQGSWNIWDGSATRGRVAQARARLQQAELAYRETAQLVDADVRRSFWNYNEARELVTASQRVVEQATESLRLARSRLSAGAATQLDVLTAQVALTEAGTNAALALHDANVALARLERAAALAGLPTGVTVEPRRAE